MSGRISVERRAFTLIELLVVIAIIAILAAILMPALGSVMESTRRMRCQTKLRDLGIALRSYHLTHDCYPLGMAYGIQQRVDSDSRSSSWSMQSFLLPYLEQRELFDRINFDVNVNKYEGTEINRTARLTKVDVFLCPTDPHFAMENTGNNYVGCVGPDYYVVKPQGMFGSLMTVRDRDVIDGLSHTIAMSERVMDWGIDLPGPGTVYAITGSPKIDLAATDGDAYRIPNLDQILDRCRESTQPYWYFNGRQWGRGGMSWSFFNTILPPNTQKNCRWGSEDAPWETGMIAASSFHPGGINTLMADGSVEFIDDGIDMAVYRSKSTRDQNDQLGPITNTWVLNASQ